MGRPTTCYTDGIIDFSPQDIQNLIALGREASDAIMEVYNSNTTQVEHKADNSPLTQADKASHEIIVAGLERLFPEIPIVSEKGDLDAQRALLDAPVLWFVDPIDGTKEFVGRTDEFCIGIGLVVDNRPAFDLIVAPTFDTIYYGGPTYGSLRSKEVVNRLRSTLRPCLRTFWR